MRTLRYPTLTFTLVDLLGGAGSAGAHAQLTNPPYRDVQMKDGPCGAPGSTRGTPTTYTAGQTIAIEWNETIDHPGHYRIAFLADGQAFRDPVNDEDAFPEVVENAIPDRVVDGANGPGDDGYTFEFTFPDVNCDNCTLQMIQVMKAAPPYDPDGGDFYYQCADITLTGGSVDTPDAGPLDSPDAGPLASPDAGDGADGGDDRPAASGGTAVGGCAAGGGSGAGVGSVAGLWLALAGLVRVVRRRRRGGIAGMAGAGATAPRRSRP